MKPSDLYPAFLSLAQRFRVSYADLRVVRTQRERMGVTDDQPTELTHEDSLGMAVRVLKNGGLGFAATPYLTQESLAEAFALATEIAEASGRTRHRPVVFDPLPETEGEYQTPIQQDPFAVSLRERMDRLRAITALRHNLQGSPSVSVFLDTTREERWFFSTEHRRIHQVIYKTGTGVTVSLGRGHRGASRSYPTTQSGQYETAGLELLDRLNFPAHLPRVLEEARELLYAKDPPEGVYDVVIDGPLVSLIIHESIGHALELDRVFGEEASFSGTSYATVDQLGKLRIGSALLNIVADGRTPRGLATAGFDDEGVETHAVDLIKEGILVGYLSNREFAHLIGRPSSASAFAKGWQNLPLIRITNVNLKPHRGSLQDLIAGVDRGVYISGVKSWSIDDRREHFQFAGHMGWRIRGGRLAEAVRAPSFVDDTVHFWRKLDAVAGPEEWEIWGTPNCGKGEPGQTIGTAQGAAPARFRGVKLVRGR